MVLNGVFCADVPLRNDSVHSHSITHFSATCTDTEMSLGRSAVLWFQINFCI